jgi:hypothetical protein
MAWGSIHAYGLYVSVIVPAYALVIRVTCCHSATVAPTYAKLPRRIRSGSAAHRMEVQ